MAGEFADAAEAAAELEPIQGWAWQAGKNWFELPLDARVDEQDPESARMWHKETSRWLWIAGEGITRDNAYNAYGASAGARPWSDGPKEKDGDVPFWDGKTEHRTTYFRRIDLWEATTGVEPKKRGIRLLAKLTGDAFEKLENVSPQSLEYDDGVERFKKCIINVFEPIEDYRVGKIMDGFLEEFFRRRDQELLDYNLAWEKELQKAEKVAGELTPRWKAHLYLKKIMNQKGYYVLNNQL